MNDPAWINAALISARPQAIAALLRYFRDMDTAEEAYQDACLRALRNWTQNGPPRGQKCRARRCSASSET
jgi:RNA polymerase sigma-70 factor (ECF subfamily)